MLEGEFAFYLGDGVDGAARRVVAGPGEVVPLAGNVPRTVRNETAADAVAFVVHSPGARWRASSARPQPLAAGGAEPSVADVLDVAHRHGIEMLGPYAEVSAAP